MYSSENSSCLRLRQPNRTISPGITFVIIYRFFHNSVMQEAFPEQICSGRALLFRRFTLISPAGTEFALSDGTGVRYVSSLPQQSLSKESMT